MMSLSLYTQRCWMALFYSQKQRLVINKRSYMSAHVLLDLLNKLEKNVRLPGILPPF